MSPKHGRNLAAMLLMAGLVGIQSVAGAALLGPTPYLSTADSPFSGGNFSYFHLENFESGVLAAPGVTASPGIVLGGNGFVDSVDADDGSIDGSGLAGRSWYSNGAAAFSFAFDATVLGALPTHAGLVWTDVGLVSGPSQAFGNVTFEAFDADNNSLGVIGPVLLGDGAATGATAEDRFFGATNAGGISRIVITALDSTDWEIDHLQYGRANATPISSPGGLALMLTALLVPVAATFRTRNRS